MSEERQKRLAEYRQKATVKQEAKAARKDRHRKAERHRRRSRFERLKSVLPDGHVLGSGFMRNLPAWQREVSEFGYEPYFMGGWTLGDGQAVSIETALRRVRNAKRQTSLTDEGIAEYLRAAGWKQSENSDTWVREYFDLRVGSLLQTRFGTLKQAYKQQWKLDHLEFEENPEIVTIH